MIFPNTGGCLELVGQRSLHRGTTIAKKTLMAASTDPSPARPAGYCIHLRLRERCTADNLLLPRSPFEAKAYWKLVERAAARACIDARSCSLRLVPVGLGWWSSWGSVPLHPPSSRQRRPPRASVAAGSWSAWRSQLSQKGEQKHCDFPGLVTDCRKLARAPPTAT